VTGEKVTDHEHAEALRIGTRSSALARWQAEWVAAQLTALGVETELVHISTKGDVSSRPLGAIGGQGVFTKAIQEALSGGEVDVAVHSLKDLPTEPVDGLLVAAVPGRAGAGDVLVSAIASSVESLPAGARVGTGSARRRAQLLYARPDLEIAEIRGNLDTRLKKLDDGQYDAIVLAEAGMSRLGWQERIAQVIPKQLMLPAVGQGALGIEVRAEDDRTLSVVAPLDDPPSHHAVLAERAMLAALRAGCLAPVGAWARQEDDQLVLEGVVLDGNGTRRVSTTVHGDPNNAEALGREAAERLLAQGAAELIVASRDGGTPGGGGLG
jgi:hydroxymethylbilane synthase